MDFITFQLDWVININIQYTCDRNDSNDHLQRVIALHCEAKDTLTRRCSDTCTAHRAEKIFTGMHVRPKFNVPREQLQFLIEQDFINPSIADIFGVSLQTVEKAAMRM